MSRSVLAIAVIAVMCCCAGAVNAFRPTKLGSNSHSHSHTQPTTKHKSDVPVLSPWPEAFSVGFDVTVLGYGMIGAPSYLFYDWTQQAQRIDFGLCSANGVFAPCTVIFNATAAYLIQNNKCCQAASVGTLPPGWTSALTYVNTTLAYGETVNLFRGGDPTHDYYNGVGANSPVFLRVEDVSFCCCFLCRAAPIHTRCLTDCVYTVICCYVSCVII